MCVCAMCVCMCVCAMCVCMYVCQDYKIYNYKIIIGVIVYLITSMCAKKVKKKIEFVHARLSIVDVCVFIHY